MKVVNVRQGTSEWLAHRRAHFNASDAPAMLGESQHMTRSQLLRQIATGSEAEHSAATQKLFADGHRFEALARPIAEAIIGEELYPVVGAEGKLSASFDGVNMLESIIFEHKTLNKKLKEAMVNGRTGADLPIEYRIQMEQQLYVSRAESCLFMASAWDANDQLIENFHCHYKPDTELRKKIIDGWAQFEKELAEYQPDEIKVPLVPEVKESLPAVMIKVDGALTLTNNLPAFGIALNDYISGLNKAPQTDQDFVNLDAAVKELKRAEEALTSAENSALSQTESIEEMRRAVENYRNLARNNRLQIEKIVKAEKENRRNQLLRDAENTLREHIDALRQRSGNVAQIAVKGNFSEAIHGLKTLSSMRDKLDVELARCKVEANNLADLIESNLALVKKIAGDRMNLFPDLAEVLLKPEDDLAAIIQARVAVQEKAEAQRLEQEREKIRKEEEAKAMAAQAKSTETEAQKQVPPIANPATQIAIPLSSQAATQLTLDQICQKLMFTVTEEFLERLGAKVYSRVGGVAYLASDFSVICAAIREHLLELQGVTV